MTPNSVVPEILYNLILIREGNIFKEENNYESYSNVLDNIIDYWPLFILVLIGGQIGNFLNLKFLSNKLLAIITSGLVIFVAIRIGLKIFS